MTLGLSAAFVLSWSSGFVVTKLGVDRAAPTTVLMWRFAPLAVLLAPVLLRHLRRAERRGSARDVGRHALVGALSQSGYLLAVYGAVDLGVSTGATSLMDGVQPLVVAALAGPLLGLTVDGRQWLALGTGLLGVGVVTYADWAGGSGAPPAAYLVPLAGMACLVAATFVERGARAVSALDRLAVHCTTSAVVFTALAVATGSVRPPADTSFWAALALMVAVPTIAAYGLYWWLLEREGVTTVNSLLFLVPPVTTVWGGLAYGEPVTALTVVGLALATGATWAMVRSSPQAEPRPRARVTTRRARSTGRARASAHPPC